MPRQLVKQHLQVCGWMFLEETSIWTGGLSKADGPLHHGGHPPTHWGLQKAEQQRKVTLALHRTIWLSCPWLSWLWNLHDQLSSSLASNYTVCFPGSPACRSMLWDVSASIITGANTSSHVSSQAYVHIPSCFPAEPWLVQQHTSHWRSPSAAASVPVFMPLYQKPLLHFLSCWISQITSFYSAHLTLLWLFLQRKI